MTTARPEHADPEPSRSASPAGRAPGGRTWMRSLFDLCFAGAAYLLALASLAYLVGFLAGVGVPKHIATAPSTLGLWPALAVDVGLVLAFGLQHSITARRSFKQWWTRFVPSHLERATYLWMTAAMTALLVAAWQPIPIIVWQVEAVWAKGLIWAAYLSVWLGMSAATFHFGHLGFFGLAQVLDCVRVRPSAPPRFAARYLYALVRHPISLGWMVAPWLVPHLTVGHVVFALATMLNVLCATRFEEADLIAELGDPYRDYRCRVPAFLPWPPTARVSRRERTSSASAAGSGPA